MSKALLFLNGDFSVDAVIWDDYDLVIAADGAANSLVKQLDKIDFCVGDLDSIEQTVKTKIGKERLIEIKNQDTTDFEKCLEFISLKNIHSVDVLGGSGSEPDHFMGNLSTALAYKKEFQLRFQNEAWSYFLADAQNTIHTQVGKHISLFPFPHCKMGITKGLQYNASSLVFELGKKIGTRNKSTRELVEINVVAGDLFIFIER